VVGDKEKYISIRECDQKHEGFERECNNKHTSLSGWIRSLENRIEKTETKLWAIIVLLVTNLAVVVTNLVSKLWH